MAQDAAVEHGETLQALERAHRALLARKDIQFDLQTTVRPEPPPPPAWLERLFQWLARLFEHASPVFQVLFWGVVALAVAGILFLIVREVGGFDWLRRRKPKGAEPQYHPTTELAEKLLADADALAAEGRFAEAVHVLLLRSIDDVRQWRPRAIRPSLTSRDIEGLEVLPGEARSAFSAMARLVETSLFGGRAVDAEGFSASRRAYEAFAFKEVWA